MTLSHYFYLLVSVPLNYTINIRQKGVPAKHKRLLLQGFMLVLLPRIV